MRKVSAMLMKLFNFPFTLDAIPIVLPEANCLKTLWLVNSIPKQMLRNASNRFLNQFTTVISTASCIEI